ncbi:MAG: hypothetical protein WKG00_07235 [Polyangiaceae bacterium]
MRRARGARSALRGRTPPTWRRTSQRWQAGAFACLCPTTERDLGDGLPDLGALVAAGVRLCTGVDSHVLTDPFEDMRGLELGERLRTGRRVTLRPAGGQTPAEALWQMGGLFGAQACGFADAGGEILLDRGAPALQLVDEAHLLDAVVYAGGPRLVLGHRPRTAG